MAPPAESSTKLGERLARAMVDRLQPLVPEGVRLYATGARIDIGAMNGSQSIEFMVVLGQEPGDQDHLANAIWMIMDHVQDFVVELVLREPWPSRPDPVHGSSPLPCPDVRREVGGYRLLYAPVLELPVLTDEELGIGSGPDLHLD